MKKENFKDIKIRRTWNINPKQKVKGSNKVYKRNRENKITRQMMEDFNED